ncbi:MAG: hypothetical protein K2W82_16610 [Candidatus Obscuribacterales bacterium]|nr:hypothetical protein [Candidatus Obscuribacterales bacterium]
MKSKTDTLMRVVNGKLQIGLGPCRCCLGSGTVAKKTKSRCDRCLGRGEILCNGPRSMSAFMRQCRKCGGSGDVETTHHDKQVKCRRCLGVNSQRRDLGSRQSTVPECIVSRLRHRVYRVQRELKPWEEEALKGFSTTFDAGHSRSYSSTKLLRRHRVSYASAGHISQEDGTLCRHIGIFVLLNKVIVGPVFDPAKLPDFKKAR